MVVLLLRIGTSVLGTGTTGANNTKELGVFSKAVRLLMARDRNPIMTELIGVRYRTATLLSNGTTMFSEQ